MTELTDKLKAREIEDRFYYVKSPSCGRQADEKKLVLVFVGERQRMGVEL